MSQPALIPQSPDTREIIGQWKDEYNMVRPHITLGYLLHNINTERGKKRLAKNSAFVLAHVDYAENRVVALHGFHASFRS